MKAKTRNKNAGEYYLGKLVRSFERSHERDIKRGHAVISGGPLPTYPPGSVEHNAWLDGFLHGKRFATYWSQHTAIQAAKCYASAAMISQKRKE
jgi:hypothetical protein